MMYKRLNVLLGWVVFAIATYTYCSTIEPTASFWDCGEFIASAFKLEVGHPPGNPFFMLVGNFFTHFAKDTAHVAVMVNVMSALLSAFTILFLFWTITHLTKKIVQEDCAEEPSLAEAIKILGSGVVGALVYTWSDTFWFSAVEGEVYAFSSFLTALVFWLILKWEEVAGKSWSDKWIVLIAYIVGISIGVHLLNLLCIPAIVLVYYFRKAENVTLKGTIGAVGLSFVIVLLALYGLIQGLVEVAGYFELFFVNVLGLSFQSGVLFYLLCTIAILIWGVYETEVQKSPLKMRISFALSVILLGIPFIGSGFLLGFLLIVLMIFLLHYIKNISFRFMNVAMLCLMVMFFGYSAYAVIVIRSTANTPMDQNSPEDVFTLGRYLNREQYGETPLFYGKTFASIVKREYKNGESQPVIKEGECLYAPQAKRTKDEKDHYLMTGRKQSYVMDERFNMLFPRMHSEENHHVQAYKEWSKFKGTPVRIMENGQSRIIRKPTFMENLSFFFSYQVNFMYWRYFMWNFSGRQTDIQGNGEPLYGNWITGIKFIDNYLVGPQDNLPPILQNNKGRNVFYMLPLLLGILGIFYQIYRGKQGVQGFWVVFFLFFMTGLAIVLYLNQTPYQPRERDYAYAGSFYAFAIWVGMGVAGLASLLEKIVKNKKLSSSIAFILAIGVPFQMVSQTWDDHDRSKRTPCRDFGHNYLDSCPPNAVLFTVGDNDTFPLWYDQEVEGFRTDVRVCNLSYLQTDWYIDQMRRPAYKSAPLQLSMKPWQYANGNYDIAYVVNRNGDAPLDLKYAMNWLFSEDPRTKRIGTNEDISYIPDDLLTIKVDKEAVIRAGIVERKDSALILDEMQISLKGRNYISKADIAILDMLSNNDWTRPILFSSKGGNGRLDLNKYLRMEGFAYRLVPLKNDGNGEMVNVDGMYENMMNKFHWAGLELGNDIYVDETFMGMCKQGRMLFSQLINALINREDSVRAIKALRYCEKVIPCNLVPYDYTAIELGRCYYRVGLKEDGDRVMKEVGDYASSLCTYIDRLSEPLYRASSGDIEQNMAILGQVIRTIGENNQDLAQHYYDVYQSCLERCLSLRR